MGPQHLAAARSRNAGGQAALRTITLPPRAPGRPTSSIPCPTDPSRTGPAGSPSNQWFPHPGAALEKIISIFGEGNRGSFSIPLQGYPAASPDRPAGSLGANALCPNLNSTQRRQIHAFKTEPQESGAGER